MKRVALIATCFVLAGCKTQIGTDSITSNLVAATEAEAVTAPLVICLPPILLPQPRP
jgi:hypothetical protein